MHPAGALEEVLRHRYNREAAGIQLEEAHRGDHAAAPIVCDGDGTPQSVVAPHRVDDARPAGFNALRGVGLLGVRWRRTVAAHGEVDCGERREFAWWIGHPPDGERAGAGKARVENVAGGIGAKALRGLQMEDAHAAGLQIGEVVEAGRCAAEQRSFWNVADLGALKGQRGGVEHVGGEVDGVVVDTERRQVGEVGGRRLVVERGIERVVVPSAGRVGGCRDGQQKKRGERVAATRRDADEEVAGIEERARVGDEVGRRRDRLEEVDQCVLREHRAILGEHGERAVGDGEHVCRTDGNRRIRRVDVVEGDCRKVSEQPQHRCRAHRGRGRGRRWQRRRRLGRECFGGVIAGLRVVARNVTRRFRGCGAVCRLHEGLRANRLDRCGGEFRGARRRHRGDCDSEGHQQTAASATEKARDRREHRWRHAAVAL